MGTKFSPNDYITTNGTAKGFDKQPWLRLKFRITKPFYYYYTYASQVTAAATTGDNAKAATTAGFVAGASASLSSNADSNYKIEGSAAGTVGNIIELEEGTAFVATIN